MFNIEFLHAIREYEFARIVPHLRSGARILEIGGGTGYQAARLRDSGFAVSSIDVAAGIYRDGREFPVQEYDGRHIPFPDATFDIVFSSNVLEHIPDLAQIHRETRRVLRPDGYCVHVMPTGSWRFWTNIAHYVELAQRVTAQFARLLPGKSGENGPVSLRHVVHEIAQIVKHFAVVPRHGEFGNAFTEIVTFGRRHWVDHFIAQGFVVMEVAPLGLFYSGHMIFGSKVPVRFRQGAAAILGGACTLYKVKPLNNRISD
jgi:SAM-dependent methyltransferase